MSATTKPVPVGVVPLPRCPHCEEEMPTISIFQWNVNYWLVMAVVCTSCRRTLSFQVLPPMEIAPPAEVARPS
jgi:uncharacterized CHY-type Zn-finger protein